MKTDRPRSARVLLWTLLLGLSAAVPGHALATAPARPQAAPAKPPAAAQAAPVLRDRIVASVDEDPILASEIERAIVLGLQQPTPGEGERAFRRRVLDALIADRLRLHEIDRFGFEEVPIEEVDRQVAEIRARFASEEEFRQALQKVGLRPQGLRLLVARQLMVLIFVEERLGPRVFVGLEEINAYYRNVLTPEMKRSGKALPPIEDVREEIRNVLRQQKLSQEIERWSKELRNKADVNVFPEPPAGKPLPPVIERIEKKKPAKE